MFGRKEHQALVAIMRKMVATNEFVKFERFIGNARQNGMLPQYGIKIMERVMVEAHATDKDYFDEVGRVMFATQLARDTALKAIEKTYLTRVMQKLPMPIENPAEV